MSTRQAKEKVTSEVMRNLRVTSDPARVSAVLAEAKDHGINQRTLRGLAGGQDALADRRFDQDTGRYHKAPRVMERAEDMTGALGSDDLAIQALKRLTAAREYQTQSDKRQATYTYPDGHAVAEDTLRATLHAAVSPAKRAHVVRHSLTCTHALLSFAGIPPWQSVDADPSPAIEQAVAILRRPIRSTQQPVFHELLAPSWSYVAPDIGEVALALRADTLLSTVHPEEMLIFPAKIDGTKTMGKATVRRAFTVSRHRYWLADPALDMIAPQDEAPAAGGYPPLATSTIADLTEFGKLADPDVNELARPLADLVVARHELIRVA
jgi:hypothetical protein